VEPSAGVQVRLEGGAPLSMASTMIVYVLTASSSTYPTNLHPGTRHVTIGTRLGYALIKSDSPMA
jgi:hypothetical protein